MKKKEKNILKKDIDIENFFKKNKYKYIVVEKEKTTYRGEIIFLSYCKNKDVKKIDLKNKEMIYLVFEWPYHSTYRVEKFYKLINIENKTIEEVQEILKQHNQRIRCKELSKKQKRLKDDLQQIEEDLKECK